MDSGDLILLESLGLGWPGDHVGIGQTNDVVASDLTLEELVVGTGIRGLVELAGEGLSLDGGATRVELDVLVLDIAVSASNRASVDWEDGLVGGELGHGTIDGDTETTAGGGGIANNIECDYSRWKDRKGERERERERLLATHFQMGPDCTQPREPFWTKGMGVGPRCTKLGQQDARWVGHSG